MYFGSNSVLERVVFGLKCVLHRVRVSECRPSRVIQNLAEHIPPGQQSKGCKVNSFWPIFWLSAANLSIIIHTGYNNQRVSGKLFVRHFDTDNGIF